MEQLFQILCLTFLLQHIVCQQLVNIALLKSPTQNGTLNYDGHWDVSNSVDGKTDCTNPTYQTFSGTDIVDDPWWQLDLGSIYNIQAVHVLGRQTVPPRQLVGFRLQVGLEEKSLSMVYRNNDTAYNNGDIWINISMNIRIIKIDLPNDNVTRLPQNVLAPLVICEVEVYALTDEKIKKSSNASTSIAYNIYGPGLAIDGKYPNATDTPEQCNCCSISGIFVGFDNSWLTIDFGQLRLIGGVYITGRKDVTNTYQSKDLSIFISSTSPKQEEGQYGEPIWHISRSELGTFFRHTFQQPRLFRFLSIIRPFFTTQYMTLCEIDFITTECGVGHYGNNCTETCGYCVGGNKTCTVTDGTCLTGCVVGYDYTTDNKCKTQCSLGRFGSNCTETCGHCVGGNKTCLLTDGTCPAGCVMGYDFAADNKCKTQCSLGRFGSNCTETCGHCVGGNKTCLLTDGTCPAGCVVGFDFAADNKCQTECGLGHYGSNCTETCGHCVGGNKTCLLNDGTCPAGCAAGYNYTANTKCTATCNKGRFGTNCNETCGQCINGTTACSVSNGTCPVGCVPGYDYAGDRTCKQECTRGYYGTNCKDKCGHCKGGNTTCSVVDGNCTDGCIMKFDYAANMTCKQASSVSQISSIPTTPIVGSLVGVVVLLIVVVFLVVFLKRRGCLPKRRKNRKEERTDDKTETEFATLEYVASGRDKQNKRTEKEATGDKLHENGGYYSFNPGDHVAKSIKIRDLWNYITSKRANNFEDLFVEFQDVLGGVQFECVAAQRDENVGKNKYRNMYPYDHCRVKLNVSEGQTDYINASHVDGYERVNKFIAAQGPQKRTIEDFWLMVWQQGVSKVVMLTNVFEMGKDKCEQYWPNEGTSIQYGGIEVTLNETTEKSDYSIRKFELRMEHEKLRRVEQFHFKSWPDKDVPDSTWCLVNFWRVAMNKDQGKSPIVVHCSAGIGRTGTFIALDALYHQAVTEGGIRPVSVIETLRRQRINMVQTRYQYAFLHEAVADALLVGTHFFWASQLASVCNFFRGRNPESSVTRAQEQFKLISECITSTDGHQQASSAAAAENIYEETGEPMVEPEYGNISTLQSEISEYRPKTKDRNSASIQQMNAIYLPNYAEASTYILAETPSESSLAYFWSLVEEQNVTTIVNLTETTHPYFQISCTLGANGGKPLGRFVVNVVKDVNHKEYAITSIVYKEEDKKENNAGFTVKMFSLSAWQHGTECPSDLDPLIALLEEVNKWHPYVSEAKPVLFICGDGRTRCGLVAAILNETQRMRNEEGHVNIVETVMTMKKRAGGVISAEQLQVLYEAVLRYALRIGYVLDTGDYNNI